MNDMVNIEYKDGAIWFHGTVSLIDGGPVGVSETGQIKELSSVLYCHVSEGYIELKDRSERVSLEPGEYLITEYGVFRKIDI